MFLLRVEYEPVGGRERGDGFHVAIMRVNWDNILYRADVLLDGRSKSIKRVHIEAQQPTEGRDDYLLSAGPHPLDNQPG